MKKFTKICLLTALILILVGGTVCVVGGISGGWRMVKEMENDERWKGLAEQYGEGFWSNGRYFEWDEISEELDEWDEEVEAWEDAGADAKEVQRLADVDMDEIEDLEISIGGASLYVLEAEDGNLSFEVDGKGKYSCYESGDVLILEGGRNKSSLSSDEKVYLYLPKDKRFEDVLISVGGGLIEIGTIEAEEIEFTIGAGSIKADEIVGKKLKIEVGAGKAILKNIRVDELDAEVGMGECRVQGSISKKVKVKCGMGNVDLALSGKEDDYNYDVSCAAGNISFGDKSYSGLADDVYIDNDAEGECSLECAMGNIGIVFE